MKKLMEGLPFYRDKLHEEVVYGRFQDVLTKVKRAEFPPPPPSLPEIITRDNKQARSNKIANKSESDLAEFEAVRFPILLLARRLLISHITFFVFLLGLDRS